jgi:myo-inositol-1-phosphate synthase
VTELGPFAPLELAALDRLVLGGHELPGRRATATVTQLAQERVLDPALLPGILPSIARLDAAIRPGIGDLTSGDRDGVERIRRAQRDIAEFREREQVERVVVVNVASTEPPLAAALPEDPEALLAEIERGAPVPASVLYAYAALDSGHAHVNFTPSTGSSLPALAALAEARAAAHAGRDGKTGETLLRSALAPMFALRALRVLAWHGQNILGNADGRTLAGSGGLVSKTAAKQGVVPAILGYRPAGGVGIDYVEPLGDWKVAWDHVAFRGFLGARMSLELSWHGADSALAAPLIIDLARLVDFALRRGERGLFDWLGFFFKAPMGSGEHRLDRQWQALLRHVGARE